MKKWIIGIVLIGLAGYFFLPNILQVAGYKTTRVMVYNGTLTAVQYNLNGEDLELAPGEVQVYRSSRFTNKLIHNNGTDTFKATFGPGQHFINLGDSPLRLMERLYRWEEDKQAFFPYPIENPVDRLLYDASLGKGLHTLDNCWDCCLLLPPDDRPYRYLTPENKDRRFILSSRM